MESAYLVSPPHHQVGEAGDPADGTQERDWKELLRRLPEKKRKNRKSKFSPKLWTSWDIVTVVPAVQTYLFPDIGQREPQRQDDGDDEEVS